MPTAHRLTTLGRLALSDADGVEDPTLATRRRKLALLTVLAVSRKPVSRDALVDLFWGDQPEERARHSLSDALSHLRRVLGREAISTRRAEVSLATGTSLEVDVVSLHAAAQAQQWGAVAALYGGPFLDGVHVPDSPRFEQWVTTQRAHAERLFDTACRREIARLRQEEAWEACASLAARWLDLSPHSDEAAAAVRSSLSRVSARPEGSDARADAEAREPAPVSAAAVRSPDAPPAPMPLTHQPPLVRRWLAAAGLLAAAALGLTLVRPTAAASAEADAPSRSITTRSPEALALYLASFASPNLTGSAPDAVEKIEAAIRLDSTFALAWRRLAQELDGDENQRARVHEALTRARALSDGVSEYERQIILGDYHMLVSGDLASAASAYRAVLALDPRNIGTWHRLGMVYQYLGDDRRAAEAYGAANRLAPTSAARWINLTDVRFASGDTVGALRAIDSMALHLPGHPSVYVLGANVASATGDLDRALLQLRAYATSSPGDARVQAFARMYRSRVHWSAGRLDAGDADARDALARNLVRGDAYWALRDGLALAQATVWLRHDPTAAARELRTATTRAPFDSLSLLDRPWLEMALVEALVGHAARSRSLLARYAREVPPHVRYREEAPFHHAEGTLALVEGRYDDAVRHLEQSAHPECRVCGLPELGLAHEARGDLAAARRAYREYLDTPTLRRTDLLDALHRTWVTNRLAGTGPAWSPTLRP